MKKDDERATSRPERVPLHKQRYYGDTLERPGYVRRYVNDLPGRIDKFLLAGWTIVVGNAESTHDGQAQIESQMGSQIRRVVNKDPNASCRYAVLMEIPEEYYQADKAEQQKLIDEKEAAFDRSGLHKATGMYGGITRSVDNSRN